jgi:hypothetical protein
MTGSTDGRPYQLAGTVPTALRPGLAYPGAVRSTVATTVLAGSLLIGPAPGRSRPPGLAEGAAGNRTTACCATARRTEAAGGPPPDGPPHDESSSPAATAPAAATVTLAVFAVRAERIFRLVSVVLASLRSTAVLRFRFVTHSDGAVT